MNSITQDMKYRQSLLIYAQSRMDKNDSTLTRRTGDAIFHRSKLIEIPPSIMSVLFLLYHAEALCADICFCPCTKGGIHAYASFV